MKKRLFVDMDGTLARWCPESTMDDLLSKGYFLNLPENGHMVEAINRLRETGLFEIYLLSSVLTESAYAGQEKLEWVKKRLPGVEVILVPYGMEKSQYVPGGITDTDILLDDYSVNLHEWSRYGRGIKCRNGINGTKGTWTGPYVSAMWPGDMIADMICCCG